jgi:peptide/nickel transport system permease protein
MLAFIAKRIVNYIVLTIVATTLGYILASTTLNPAARFLGRNPAVPQGTIDASLRKLGADPDTPLIVRTWTWWSNLVTHGSLGMSTRGTEVTADIVARSGTSLRLLVIGTLLGAILGVLLGVWNAVRQYRTSDQVSTYLSFAVLATPTFVIAVVLMILATAMNQGLGTQVIRFTGEYTPGVNGFFPVLGDRLIHLLLPTISLTIGAVATSARSKGRTRGSAIMRHGVRVALIPMSTFFAYSFGLILTGASITELVFSWHGMGEYFVQGITNNDINAASGTILFTAILVLIAGTLADLLYAALDPRVRV